MLRPRLKLQYSTLWIIFGLILIVFILFNILGNKQEERHQKVLLLEAKNESVVIKRQDGKEYNLWIIFTKVIKFSPLYYNFKRVLRNVLKMSSIPIVFHFIVDKESKELAREELSYLSLEKLNLKYNFYDVKFFSESIKDIVDSMKPYFSSEPGTYYSDALFYISLGLHKLAPSDQKLAVMIDCDVHFKRDVKELFDQFTNFTNENLIGLAPELSPVYKHILFTYKNNHKTQFGEPLALVPRTPSANASELDKLHPLGFQGFNSGVLMFNFTALRLHEEYNRIITNASYSLKSWVEKYSFRGHLGDQDFYTLLGFEKPHLVHHLDCGFNRQLCTWWRDNGGYKAIFDDYFKCASAIVVVHGNCNTKIP